MREMIIDNAYAEQLITAFVMLFLGGNAMVDYRKKTVSFLVCAVCGAAAVACNILVGRMTVGQMCVGCATGALMLLMSFISKQQIGYGDGMILIVIGMWLGGFAAFMTLMLGSTIAATVLSVLLVAGRVKKGEQVAFIPFLLCGFVGVTVFV